MEIYPCHMPSRDAHVLAGNIGSSSRTKKINNMLDWIDKFVSEAREKESVEKIQVRSSTLATKMNFSRSTITKNGFPNFFTSYFESITYLENKGLVVKIEEYVEERKKQREKVSELKS